MAMRKNVGRGRATSNQRVGNVKTGGSMLPFQNDASMRAAYRSGKGIVASASGIKRAGNTVDNILLASNVIPIEAVAGRILGAVGRVARRVAPTSARVELAALRVARRHSAGTASALQRAEDLASDSAILKRRADRLNYPQEFELANGRRRLMDPTEVELRDASRLYDQARARSDASFRLRSMSNRLSQTSTREGAAFAIKQRLRALRQMEREYKKGTGRKLDPGELKW